jgi:hypothetical protein
LAKKICLHKLFDPLPLKISRAFAPDVNVANQEYSHLIEIHGVHRSGALPSELAAISDVTTNWHELAGAKHVPTIVGNSLDAVAKFSGICQKLDRGLVITWPSIERWIPAVITQHDPQVEQGPICNHQRDGGDDCAST